MGTVVMVLSGLQVVDRCTADGVHLGAANILAHDAKCTVAAQHTAIPIRTPKAVNPAVAADEARHEPRELRAPGVDPVAGASPMRTSLARLVGIGIRRIRAQAMTPSRAGDEGGMASSPCGATRCPVCCGWLFTPRSMIDVDRAAARSLQSPAFGATDLGLPASCADRTSSSS
jgi:hypothetical protein